MFDVAFAKYMALCLMMIIGTVPMFFAYLSPDSKKSYGFAKTWMFWWWLLPVYKLVVFVLNN